MIFDKMEKDLLSQDLLLTGSLPERDKCIYSVVFSSNVL